MLNPQEIFFGEVLLPPLLIAAILGLIAASLTSKMLNKYRLSRYFFFPPLVMFALIVIYTVIFGMIIIPF